MTTWTGKLSPWFFAGATVFAALFLGLPQLFGKAVPTGEWQAIYFACALFLLGIALCGIKGAFFRATGPFAAGLGLIMLAVALMLLFSG